MPYRGASEHGQCQWGILSRMGKTLRNTRKPLQMQYLIERPAGRTRGALGMAPVLRLA